MRISTFLLVFLILVSSRSAFSQETASEWENYLLQMGTGKSSGQISKEKSQGISPKPTQWVQLDQRETMGQKCGSGMIFTFVKMPQKVVQQKVCVDSTWVASQHTWRVQVIAGKEPELIFDNKTAYFLRIVPKNGSPHLRFTKPGKNPGDSTIHYYFQLQ
ncbi:hypothetical protein J0X19_22300 [Hymenobacter sp. BT186]|uniref:Uncharacterized protein n=1 Tax=Hymenobacter telluris TaxID=2816474 RepID=A0A939F0Q9_9BACT|nr:hypothetical protein [Hymenobacter telluris]MBO0360709.1 hypothetical protein [Hymenobacter telluris]MBW3376736.1 hypothetical protein [Hymenobacter norwichensis]